MSTYNIREKFSYVIASSSIDYIRNYNFNSATVSDIPLSMANSDSEIPITVNMTTTVPWMLIVDPNTGRDLRYPSGNVVLQPSSSAVVLVKLDLPSDIENTPESILYPNINLEIKSGSFPIILPSSAALPKNVIVTQNDIYTISVGERVEVNIAVYDVDGNQDTSAIVEWKSNNMSIVQVEQPENTQADYNPYTPRIVRGISPGETTVIIDAGNSRTTTIKFTVREPSTPADTSSRGGDGASRTPQA